MLMLDRGCHLLFRLLLCMACFQSNFIAQSTMAFVSVYVLIFDKLFPQFVLPISVDDGFVIMFCDIPWLFLSGLVSVGTRLTCAELI